VANSKHTHPPVHKVIHARPKLSSALQDLNKAQEGLHTTMFVFLTESTNPLVTIERPSAESAVIKFWPTQQEQQELAGEGIQGQLVVEYDVDRTSRPGEVLVQP